MGGSGGFILQKVSPGRNAPQTTTNMEPENGAPWKKRYFDNFEVLGSFLRHVVFGYSIDTTYYANLQGQ